MKKKLKLENIEVKSFTTRVDSGPFIGGTVNYPLTVSNNPECILETILTNCPDCTGECCGNAPSGDCETEYFCGTDFFAGCQQAV